MNEIKPTKPGVCVPWEEAKKNFPEIKDNEELVQRVWEENDAETYMFLWQLVLSF